MVAHGSLTRLLIDGAEYSGYFNSSTYDQEGTVEDVTAYGAPNMAKAYTRTLQTGKVTLKGFFDPTVLDPELATLRTQSGLSIVSIAYAGFALGNPVNTFSHLESKYNITSPMDKVAKVDGEQQVSGALTTGVALDAFASQSSTGTGTSVNQLAASTNGGYGQLHVTSGSGSLTVTIQHSTNNSTWVTLVSFTAATGPGAQRIQVAAGTTVNQWLREIWTVGSGGPFTFTASFART